jgi:nucleoid-associated protein YgaU
MPNENQLAQMKQKYATVLTTIQQEQIQLSHVHIQDNKLFIQGIAPTEQAKNKVWDQIKLVSANWAQELTADISVDPNSQSAAAQSAGGSAGQQRSYTVQPGDSLSKISKEAYGNASQYMKIFEANRDVLSDPNKISPGQKLKIPA